MTFRCGHCRKKFSVATRHAGKKVNCPNCDHQNTVPGGRPDEEQLLESILDLEKPTAAPTVMRPKPSARKKPAAMRSIPARPNLWARRCGVWAIVFSILALMINWVPVISFLGITIALFAVVLAVVAVMICVVKDSPDLRIAVGGIAAATLAVTLSVFAEPLQNAVESISFLRGDDGQGQTIAATDKPRFSFALDGLAKDWQQINSFWKEGGDTRAGKFSEGIDIKRVFFAVDDDHLYGLLRCQPSVVERLHKGESTGPIARIYFDTDRNPTTGCRGILGFEYGEINGYELELSIQGVDSTGPESADTGPFVRYTIKRVGKQGKFGYNSEMAGKEQRSTDHRSLIKVGTDGIELAIPLALLDAEAGKVLHMLLAEEANVTSRKGYTKGSLKLRTANELRKNYDQNKESDAIAEEQRILALQKEWARRPLKLRMDGKADDFSGVEPFWAESGVALPPPYRGRVDITQVHLGNDEHFLFMFFHCRPPLEEAFDMDPTFNGVYQLYLDTDATDRTGSATYLRQGAPPVEGVDIFASIDLKVTGQLNPDTGELIPESPHVSYSLYDDEFKSIIRNSRQTMDKTWPLITYGPDGIELAVPLRVLNLAVGQKMKIFFLEKSARPDDRHEGVSHGVYTVK